MIIKPVWLDKCSTYKYYTPSQTQQGFACHPAEMGATEIEAFLSHLAREVNFSASTQNQAFNALLFLDRNVFWIELAIPVHALRAKRAQRLPTVLSKAEVDQVLVREGKGEKDCLTMLPASLVEPLKAQIAFVKTAELVGCIQKPPLLI